MFANLRKRFISNGDLMNSDFIIKLIISNG